jgi:hypothetical protein
MKIREARAADLDRLVTFDAVAQQDAKRTEFLRRAIEHGQCLVCIDNDAAPVAVPGESERTRLGPRP